MGNNYPYFPQQQQSFPRQQYMESPLNGQFMGIKGRPVSSLEEARAMSIDFDGSIFYFPDLANRRIYTKQINLDGTATLNVYEYKELPDPQTQAYVTREEFNAAIEQLKNAIPAAAGSTRVETSCIAPSASPQAPPQQQYNF